MGSAPDREHVHELPAPYRDALVQCELEVPPPVEQKKEPFQSKLLHLEELGEAHPLPP